MSHLVVEVEAISLVGIAFAIRYLLLHVIIRHLHINNIQNLSKIIRILMCE